MNSKVSVVKQIASHLRSTIPNFNSKNDIAVRYIMDQYRKNRVTDEQLCKAKQELEYIAKSYLCYLKSSSKEQTIHEEYHGKGERTVADTAKLVGFKLPTQPK